MKYNPWYAVQTTQKLSKTFNFKQIEPLINLDVWTDQYLLERLIKRVKKWDCTALYYIVSMQELVGLRMNTNDSLNN